MRNVAPIASDVGNMSAKKDQMPKAPNTSPITSTRDMLKIRSVYNDLSSVETEDKQVTWS